MKAINRLSELAVEPSSLVELLRKRALLQPHKEGYTFLNNDKEVGLTYAELDRQARAIGASIQKRTSPGERVLLLYPPGIEFIAAFFGCLYSGVIAVPVYPPNPSRLDRTLPRLMAITRDAQPLIGLTTSSILPMAEYLSAEEDEFKNIQWLATDSIDNSDLAEQWQEPEIDGSTIAFLQYTSGSTAAPRGVMVSQGNLLHNEGMIKKAFWQSERGVIVSWLPLYHDMGLIGGALQPLYVGARCVLLSPVSFLKKPFRWLEAISRYKATTSGGPNFAYDLCVRKITPEQLATLDLSSWVTAFNGAEPIWHESLERFTRTFEPCGFRREAFFPCFGLAEATLLVSCGLKRPAPAICTVDGSALAENRVVAALPGDKEARTLVSCGESQPSQRIAIVDPLSLTECPTDRVGEIWVSGPSVAKGYWNRPEDTEYTFRAYLADTGDGPFLRTGDLGFIKDGELFVTGRFKDLIIIRGLNHYPQDIEWTVEKSFSSIRPGCCAAFSVEIDGKENLVVVAEVDETQPIDPESMIETIKRTVAKNHDLQAHAIVLLKVGGIPKTSSGKIQRHACRSGFLNGTLEVLGGS